VNRPAPLSDDVRSLYQETILDHAKHPRNFRELAEHTCKAEGNNPMCGDRVTVAAKVAADGALEDVAFQGKGCAISIASASMMTEALRGQDVKTARKLFAAVHDLCTGKTNAKDVKAKMGEEMDLAIDRLASLSGVAQFPVRVKCATLPWHALMSCLEGKAQATTET
jgi:nitrogen fixation NifU-like protein